MLDCWITNHVVTVVFVVLLYAFADVIPLFKENRMHRGKS